MAQASIEFRPIVRRPMLGRYVTAGLVLVTSCFMGPCNSQEAHAYGVGGDSCVSYISSLATSQDKSVSSADNQKPSQSTIYREWLLGFISGHNATLNDPAERVLVDDAAVNRYVGWWCGQNRASNVSAAIHQYLRRADP